MDKSEKFMELTQKAFIDVSNELIACDFEKVDRYVAQSSHTLTIVIGITGKSKGRILLECDILTAEKFAVEMNFGDPLEDPKDLYLYIAEFANMVSGRAATYINNVTKNREKWLSPPTIFSGDNLEIETPNVNSKEFYYFAEVGVFKLDIGLGE